MVKIENTPVITVGIITPVSHTIPEKKSLQKYIPRIILNKTVKIIWRKESGLFVMFLECLISIETFFYYPYINNNTFQIKNTL